MTLCAKCWCCSFAFPPVSWHHVSWHNLGILLISLNDDEIFQKLSIAGKYEEMTIHSDSFCGYFWIVAYYYSQSSRYDFYQIISCTSLPSVSFSSKTKMWSSFWKVVHEEVHGSAVKEQIPDPHISSMRRAAPMLRQNWTSWAPSAQDCWGLRWRTSDE